MEVRFIRWLAVGSLGAVLFAAGGLTPARADNYDRLEHALRRDIDAVHRDETRLHDLYRKRDAQRARADWRGVQRTDRDIDHARLDLERDQAYVDSDRQQLDHFDSHRWRH